MMSEVLSYLIMITCILIRVSSKEVKWTVRDTPPKLGQDLTLFCKVDNCTIRETKRWHGGPDDKVLMLNSGISTDKTKYSTSIEKNGFILTILNLTVKDLNISYTCSCGLDLDDHILYIEDVYTVDNLNKTTNGTNYIGTNDLGGISLYVYIAIPVAILVILLIIVIVVSKRHWLSRRLNGKTDDTEKSNTEEDCNQSAPSADTCYSATENHGPSASWKDSEEDCNQSAPSADTCYSATESLEPSASRKDSERVNNSNMKVSLLSVSNPGQSSGNMNLPPGSYSQPSSSPLKSVEDIPRPHSEKTNKLHSCSSKRDNSNDTSALLQTIERLKDEKRKLEEIVERYKSHQTDNTGPCHTDTQKQVKKLQEEIDDLKQKNQQMSNLLIEKQLQTKNDLEGLVKKYRAEMGLRKKYHNELVVLKGKIRVFCRVRPKIKEDGDGPMANNVVDYDQDNDGLIYVSNKTHKFEVDKVFKQRSLQKEVFDEVKALVTSCIDGYNVCIFAYGQTGSGKTFTMEGSPSDPGINPKALKELFNEVSAKGDDWSFTITVSFIEIYNEMIRDLLSDNPSNKMEVKMNPDGGLYVSGLSLVVVKTMEDVNKKVLNVGKQKRTIATTVMNEDSSRSHALLCVTVKGVNKTTNTKTMGKLNLVDLAGSERVSKSGDDVKRLEEAKHINQSLSSLGNVINALRSKQKFVPYRYSKLTRVLQDSLGGDSKTLMIVQVAPVEKNVAETICSLNFAQRVRTVELGQASKKIRSQEM